MRLFLILGSLLALSGCSVLTAELGPELDDARLASLAPGHTTRAEVLAALGPPQDLAAHRDGCALLYEHVALREWQLGLNLGGVGDLLGMSEAALIKLSIGRCRSEREALLLFFDREGGLTAAGLTRWNEGLGKGGTLQLFAAASSVVDSGPIRAGAEQLDWGRHLLDPLPWALNRPHRADPQLRGTPVKAGQSTLEQRDWRTRSRR